MNVLQLTVHFSPNIGGVETHLDDLVRGLSERKINVTVLTYQPLSTTVNAPFFEKRKRVQIIRIPWIKGQFYKLVNKPLLEFLYLFPGLFLVAPFIISQKKIDVIHSHGLVASAVGIFWAKIFHKRIVVSTHSLYHFPKTGIYRTFVRFLLSKADVCLCLSKKSVDELVDLGINPKKITQFVYWIDTKLFYPLKTNNLKKQFHLSTYFVLLFVGRLVEEKGISVLVKSIKQVKGKSILLIAGDGPLRDEVAIEAQKSDKIRFVGKLTGEELVKYYNLADVLIIPSIHDEGFGRVILESLASGTPVIGSDRGSIPEAIDSSVGRLVKVTALNLAKEIAYLKNHPDVLKKLRQNTRKFALKKYSEKNIQTIINAYDA